MCDHKNYLILYNNNNYKKKKAKVDVMEADEDDGVLRQLGRPERKKDMKDWVKDLDIINFGSGKFSESYQDNLLDYIFLNIKPTNSSPFCVEFGHSSN